MTSQNKSNVGFVLTFWRCVGPKKLNFVRLKPTRFQIFKNYHIFTMAQLTKEVDSFFCAFDAATAAQPELNI